MVTKNRHTKKGRNKSNQSNKALKFKFKANFSKINKEDLEQKLMYTDPRFKHEQGMNFDESYKGWAVLSDLILHTDTNNFQNIVDQI